MGARTEAGHKSPSDSTTYPFSPFPFLWGGHSDVSDVLRVLGLWGGRGASPFVVLGSLPFKSEATKSTSNSRRHCSRLRGELLCWRPTTNQAPAYKTLRFQRVDDEGVTVNDENVEQPTLDLARSDCQLWYTWKIRV